MGFTWLSFYTNSANPDSLGKANEYRAYSLYSRWRSTLRWTGNVCTAIHRYHQRRAGHRKLMTLSDHLLRDAGLFRAGTKIQRMEASLTDRSSGLKQQPTNKIPGRRCVVFSTSPVTPYEALCKADNDKNRAA